MFHVLEIYPVFEYNFQKNLLDYYEIPLVILLIIAINLWLSKKLKKNPQPYFKLFFNLKLFGAVFITLLFNLYYAGGDTTAYFNDGRLLNKLILDYPSEGLRLFFTSGALESYAPDLEKYIEGFRNAYPENTWFVVKISCFLQFFTFRSMLCTAMLFSFISARAIWKFYELFLSLYPNSSKGLKWAILFCPSLILWGSGIFKDTITFAALLLFFYSTYNLLLLPGYKLKNFIMLIVSSYLLYVIKSYILFSFAACMLAWLPFVFRRKIKNAFFQAIFTPFLIVFIALAGLVLYQSLSTYLTEFTIESVLETSSNTGKYLKYMSESQEGSTYDIGILEPTISGFVSKIPDAVNVTLFRPYLWESSKPIVLFAALESLAIFLWFLYVFRNPFKAIYRLCTNPLLLAFLLFVFLFATFVGISSFNYGTLVRYKIPCIPFFLIILSILHDRGNKQNALS